MAADPASFNFDEHIPGERCAHLLNLNSLTPEQMPSSQTTLESTLPPTSADLLYLYTLLLIETPLDTQSTDLDQRPQTCSTCSASRLPPPPPSQVIIFQPPKWHIIPQRLYEQRQWDYTAVESIYFRVNGYPGVNMGEALRKKFTTLEGWDDLVLQDAGNTISCRLLFPGYPANKSPQISTHLWNRGRDPIARSTLAYHVARKLKKYLDSMSSSHTIDASTSAQWKIGEGFMHLENMFLAKLDSVSNGSFQPEIWVLDPTM